MRKKHQNKEAKVGKKEGIIMRDIREFIAPIKRKRPTPQSMAYGLQKAGYVDPDYKIKSPYKKKIAKRRRKSKIKKPSYIIRGGKAYRVG